MAQQDVRYYLNGICSRPSGSSCARLRPMGTGWRLSEIGLDSGSSARRAGHRSAQRRARAAADRWKAKATLSSRSARNHVRVQIGDVRFTSKLIDGRFPEYGARDTESTAQRSSARIASCCDRHCSARRSCRTRNTAACGSSSAGIASCSRRTIRSKKRPSKTLEVEYRRRPDGDRLQRELPTGRARGRHQRAGGVRRHRWEFELSDPGARRRADEVRRDAHAPARRGFRLPLRRLRSQRDFGVWRRSSSTSTPRGITSSVPTAPARPASRGDISARSWTVV